MANGACLSPETVSYAMLKRYHFEKLVQGTCVEGLAEAQISGSGMHFIKPEQGSLQVIFPIKFLGSLDVAIGKLFLEQLVEARKSASLGKAPICRYQEVGGYVTHAEFRCLPWTQLTDSGSFSDDVGTPRLLV